MAPGCFACVFGVKIKQSAQTSFEFDYGDYMRHGLLSVDSLEESKQRLQDMGHTLNTPSGSRSGSRRSSGARRDVLGSPVSSLGSEKVFIKHGECTYADSQLFVTVQDRVEEDETEETEKAIASQHTTPDMSRQASQSTLSPKKQVPSFVCQSTSSQAPVVRLPIPKERKADCA